MLAMIASSEVSVSLRCCLASLQTTTEFGASQVVHKRLKRLVQGGPKTGQLYMFDCMPASSKRVNKYDFRHNSRCSVLHSSVNPLSPNLRQKEAPPSDTVNNPVLKTWPVKHSGLVSGPSCLQQLVLFVWTENQFSPNFIGSCDLGPDPTADDLPDTTSTHCLSCKDIARQSCAMVPRWRIFGYFLRPVFSASSVQRVSDLHPKFALRRHHVWKYGRRPICDG